MTDGSVKARIWLAPADSLVGRVWVWSVKGLPPFVRSTRVHYGYARQWSDALSDCLAHIKEFTQ